MKNRNNIICLIIARCYAWGGTWKRHYYDKEGNCYRCGADKNEK